MKELCDASDIPVGTAKGFDLTHANQDTVFVVNVDGMFHAFLNACPHYAASASAPLAWRNDQYLNPAATHIVCAAHGARFEPSSGLCVSGPCVGKALTRVEIVTSSDGKLRLPKIRFTGDRNESTR